MLWPPASPAAADEATGAPAERPARLARADERDAWVVLATANEVGPATMRRLVARVGSARAVLELAAAPDAADALAAILEEPPSAPAIAGLRDAAASCEVTLERIARSRLEVMTAEDDDYPPALRATALPPPVLFVEGERTALSASPAVAVVGTRRPTESGRRIAARIAAALVASDAVVVSGLAVGIDGAAHAAAVDAGGATVAVLGGGHDQLFPRAHRRLAGEIAARGGAVVTEFAPWVAPRRWSFPRRNRVISGLARATVVVEAGRHSGALITARWALEEGRECFLVPGPLDAATSAGCLAFLRENHQTARIVAGVPELIVDLALAEGGRGDRGARATAAVLAEVGLVEREVGRLIAAGVGTVDQLVAATELPVATVLAAVTLLETRGLVVDALGRYRPAGSLAAGSADVRRRRERPTG